MHSLSGAPAPPHFESAPSLLIGFLIGSFVVCRSPGRPEADKNVGGSGGVAQVRLPRTLSVQSFWPLICGRRICKIINGTVDVPENADEAAFRKENDYINYVPLWPVEVAHKRVHSSICVCRLQCHMLELKWMGAAGLWICRRIFY